MRLIDADALVESIKDYPYGFRGMIVCDIAKQPTIGSKHGTWLRTEVSTQEIAQRLHTMKCSCCGEYQTAPYLGTFKVFNFCPNCGAKMEK